MGDRPVSESDSEADSLSALPRYLGISKEEGKYLQSQQVSKEDMVKKLLMLEDQVSVLME